jgi:AcrR family transcriptional regulator
MIPFILIKQTDRSVFMNKNQQRSEETRGRIMQAAVGLFSKNGYDATGVAEICQAAGVSKGAFYHHFPSKQTVFQALLENWLAMLDEQMDSLLSGAPDVPSGLVQLAAVTGQIFRDAQGQLPIFLEFWTQSSRDPVLWKTTIAPYRHFQDIFSATIQRGINEGSLGPTDAAIAGRALMALAVGVILQGLMDPEGAAWDQVAQKGIELLMSGLKPASTTGG